MSDAPAQQSPTNTASALVYAAECLAQAAVTLAEAARAMSAAAEAMSSEASISISQNNITSAPAKAPPIVSYESDGESSSMEEKGARPDDAPDETGHRPMSQNTPGDECTNPEDTDYYISDEDEDQVRAPSIDHKGADARRSGDSESRLTGPTSTQQLRIDSDAPPPTSATENEITIDKNQAYYILLDREVDVLLFVCALIAEHQKAICYMHCSVPSFNLYQKLINDVTEIPVYTISKITPAELARVGEEFLEEERSVLLLPESIFPSIELDGTESCVIHVGWPFSEQNYEAQRQTHQAHSNILVAYSGDEKLYTAGPAIIQKSKTWPKDVESFRISVEVLRPLFDQRLAEIPYQIKGQVYNEWINFHGPSGRRYVHSWTPSMLVCRANSYLLDVLRYGAERSEAGESEAPLEIPLPDVSIGFVRSNGLKSAVDEGVLRVRPADSGLNHISSLSQSDFTPPSPTLLGASRDLRLSSLCCYEKQPGSSLELHLTPQPGAATSAGTARGTFQPTTGYTYFALDEEFDAIPLMCFLAVTSGSDKIVFFMGTPVCFPHYQKLINKITGYSVIASQSNTDDQAQANQEAALKLMTCVSPTILLLFHFLAKFPPALEESTIGCCVYWGAGDHAPLASVKKNRGRLNCPMVSIIMTTAQRASKKFKPDIREHPSAQDLRDLSDDSWLSSMRKTTISVLTDNKSIASGLYRTYLFFLAKVPRDISSAEDVALRLNRFSARVLLRGNLEDGSENFPTVAGRLPAPAKTIRSYDLQPAVDAGLLIVG